MRLIVIVGAFLAIVGCATNSTVGYMVESGTDPSSGKWIQKTYSPYYELEHLDKQSGLLVRLVITLGPERVPKGFKHVGPFSDDLARSYRDGIVDWVSEIYFINTSNEPVSVEPLKLVVGRSEKVFSGQLAIQPHKWVITEPLVELHSNYGSKTTASIEFMYKNQVVKVEGEAKRMTTDDIEEKYGTK